MRHILPSVNCFLHGGDYNPDQWMDRPDILEKDIELMQKAHVNCVSVGIFAWSLLEPRDGEYDFDWLEKVMDRLYAAGISVFLATPSGARPSWMAQQHPEVLRVNHLHQKMHFGDRHNHCPSSPYYREKVRAIDTALAQRFSSHPAVIGWHLSNEYGGECHCPQCQQAFRDWLREKYGTLDELNRCWYTSVWSQRYTDWAQVESPSPLGETACCSMWVDWRRFVTAQCKSFIAMERSAVRAVNPDLPCTTNLMERFWDYDYFSLAEALDFVSWDSYPEWHRESDDTALSADIAMNHDLMRSLKKQPFVLMESTPSLVNWKPHNKLKRPGMHLLSSMQAVAHGSQSVMYFQWRKCRGGVEAFHGAVVGHDGTADTRTFRDVTAVGEALSALAPILHEQTNARACILFDWENRWAIDYCQAAQKGGMRYFDTVNMHYRALWQQGIAVDFCDERACTDLSGYQLVVAPMLFMTRNGMEEKLRAFVENGGTLVLTFFSCMVDEHDLAHLGAAPHGLTDVLGLRVDELDALYPGQTNAMLTSDGARYEIKELCELITPTTAETLGVYESDFYAGQSVLTRNRFGRGEAWYLGAKVEQRALDALYQGIAGELQLPRALPDMLPEGVVATARGNAIFLQNYSGQAQTITLSGVYHCLLTGEQLSGAFPLPVNGVRVLQKQA